MFVNPYVTERLERLPQNPGVYLMKDSEGAIIYIGKAKILKNRVRSYFNGVKTDHRAAQLMVPFVRDIEWIITETEVDALLLELNLVRKHQPKYNVRLKDDKNFPYLKLTTGEHYPRLKVVRKVYKDQHTYFGPYLNVKAMRRMLEMIPKIFRVRECDLKFPLKEKITPCLQYHIKRCDAPCANLCSQEEYKQQIDQLIPFLRGRHKEVLHYLEGEMQKAAAELKFEQASRYRDQIADIQSVESKQSIDLMDEHGQYDFIAWAMKGDLFTGVVVEYRGGRFSERRQYHYLVPLEDGMDEVLNRLLLDHYENSPWIPPLFYLQEKGVFTSLWKTFLEDRREKKVRFEFPQKGEKFKLLELTRKNAEMLMMDQVSKAAKAKNVDQSVEILHRELGLAKMPRYIEGFDISHLSGTGTVASQVVFRNGKPSKAEYKKYNVKRVEGIDDFASMREILGRRLKRLKEDQLELPDLILIDGGKGQVEAAYSQLLESGLDIPMIGLAKRIEEVFFPRNSIPTLLEYGTPGLQLLQRVRDESHRFAITFQRSKRTKDLQMMPWLEEVEGIGKASAEKIRKEFKSRLGLEKAGFSALAKTLGKSRAEAVWLKLREVQ